MELERKDSHIRVHHSNYITSIDLYDIDDNSRRTECPMNPNVNLKACQPNVNNNALLPVTGKLRYPADRGRSDILTSVGKISSDGLPFPSDEHVDCAKQIVRYLKQTKDLSTDLGGQSLMLFGFSDASHEKTGNCKSRLGCCLFMGYDSGAIYNESSSDSVVSHSSAESEIRSLDKFIRVISHVKAILNWLGVTIIEQVPIYVDNSAMIDISETMKNSDNLKHINICVNYIREKVNDSTIKLAKIDTVFNIADIHTKCLSGRIFKNHRGKVMKGFGGNPDNIHRYMEEYS